jgi:hypothetical protein
MEAERHPAVGQREAFVQLPIREPGKAVRRFLAFARSEPWKNDRHAAAYGRVILKAAELAAEQQRFFAVLLKVRHLPAVQVDFGGTRVCADIKLLQAAVALRTGDAARNLPPPQLFR